MSVETLSSVINQLLPEPHAGLLNGILFGTKASLSKDLYDALIRTGTLHIVALSGMNITILGTIIQSSLRPFLNRRIAVIATVVSIILFIWFVGASASVVRAGIMGSLGLLAITLGRQSWSLLSWFLSCGIMLLVRPAWIGDISFQLSALATIGIILFGGEGYPKNIQVQVGRRNGESAIDIIKGPVIENLRLTLSAQVFTIPLILFTFHRISLISPLPNVLIGWTMQYIMAFGICAVLSGVIYLPLAWIPAWVAWLLLEYVLKVIDWTSQIPFASIAW